MNKVKILTDSTADLSKDLIERFDISVIPMYVTIGEKSYLDGVELTTRELYRIAGETQTLPKTSAPSVKDFIDSFSTWIERGYDVVYIGVSSKLSVAMQSAQLAAKEFEKDRVFIVDSLNLSTGIGLLVLKAAEMAKQGANAPFIVQKIADYIPKVRTSFIISTLKYMYMGGRCSSIQLIAGTLLKIHPRLIVKDGGIIVGGKYRGRAKKVLDRFYEDWIGQGNLVDPERIFITHSAYPDGAEYLKEKLKTHVNAKEVFITEAGAVISSHCGPGTVGILYLERA